MIYLHWNASKNIAQIFKEKKEVKNFYSQRSVKVVKSFDSC